MKFVFAVLAGTCLIASCRDNEQKRPNASAGPSVAPGVSPPPSPPTTTLPDTGCRKTGDWQVCAVEDRLVHAGLLLKKRAGPVQHPFFHVAGTAYGVGTSPDEIEVFLYPTAAERRRDTDALDSVAVAPRGEHGSWRATPTLVTSGNLAAVILSSNDRQIERISLALGAGLPATPPPAR